MASRLNFKFLLVLIILAGTLATVVGGVMFYQLRTNAQRHVTLADELQKEGKLREARRQMARAVGKDETNLAYLDRLEEIVLQIVPESVSEANELFTGYLSILKHAATNHPTRMEFHHRYMNTMLFLAQRTGRVAFFRGLDDAVSDMLYLFPEGSAGRDLGLLHLAVARLSPDMQSVLVERDLTEASDGLARWLELHPESDLGWATSIGYALSMAKKEYLAGQRTRGDAHLAEVAGQLEQARERVQGGFHCHLVELEYLNYLRTREDLSHTDRVKELAHELHLQMEQSDDVILLTQSALSFSSLRWLDEPPDPIPFLMTYLEHHPEDIDLRFQVAWLHLHTGLHLDEAIMHAQLVIESDPLPVGYQAQFQPLFRTRSANLIIDCLMQEWESTPLDESGPLVTRIGDQVELIRGYTGDNEKDLVYIEASAKYAYTLRNYNTSTRLFEEYIRNAQARGFAIRPQVYYYSARSLEEQGHIGQAGVRLDEALLMLPDNLLLNQLRIRTFLQAGQVDQAESLLQRVVNMAGPDDELNSDFQTQISTIRDNDAASTTSERVILSQVASALEAGEVDRARTLALDALEVDPDNIRILYALAHIEYVSDAPEQSIAYLDRILGSAPNYPPAVQTRLLITEGDLVSAAIGYAEEMRGNESERNFALLFSLRRIRRQAQTALEKEDTGEHDDHRATVSRATEEMETVLALIEERYPDHPQRAEFYFSEALIAADWDRAQVLIEDAARGNLDEADGHYFAGRMFMSKGNYSRAAQSLRRVVEIMPYNGKAWQLLGASLRKIGDIVEAERSYSEAHRISPTDVLTNIGYAQLLIQTGNEGRALEIARGARRLAVGNTKIREAWLDLEMKVGDVSVVLMQRAARYEMNPEEYTNSSAFILLLMSMQPTRELLAARAPEQFAIQRWNLMRRVEKEQILEEERESWRETALEILADIKPDGAVGLPVIQWSMLQAHVLRLQGNTGLGGELLASTTDAQVTPSDRLLAQLATATYLASTHRANEALKIYDEAVATAPPDRIEGLYFRAEQCLSMGKYSETLAMLQEIIRIFPPGREPASIMVPTRTGFTEKSVERSQIVLQFIEIAIRAGDLDEAERQLDEISVDDNNRIQVRLLEALVTKSRIAQLYITDDEDALLVNARLLEQILQEIEQKNPDNVDVHIIRAEYLIERYGFDQNTVDLDDAMRALARANAIDPYNPSASDLRFAVQKARGNVQGAIHELTRQLREQPADDNLRTRLMRALLREGQFQDAMDVVDMGIDLYREGDLGALWQERGGDIQQTFLGSMSRAREYYGMAFALMPTAERLTKLVSTMLNAPTPEFQRGIQAVEANPGFLAQSPSIRTIYALALYGAGRESDAMREIAQAYHHQRSRIEDALDAPSTISSWLLRLRQMLRNRSLDEVEAMTRDLARGGLDLYELNTLAQLWFQEGDPDRAFDLQRRAIAVADGAPDEVMANLHFVLGNFHLQSGDKGDALQCYERVVALAPSHGRALNNAAYLRATHASDPAGALEYATRASVLLPADWAVIDTLGWIQYLLGDLGQAKISLKRSTALNPGPGNLLHLAQALQGLGQKAEALSVIEKAILQHQSQTPDDAARLEKIRATRAEIRLLP